MPSQRSTTPRLGRGSLRARGVLGAMVAATLVAGGLAGSQLEPGRAVAVPQSKPYNPSDGEISGAQEDRARKAADVGRLQGLVTKASGEMDRLNGEAELAGELYLKASADYTRAQHKVALTQQAQRLAHKRSAGAQGELAAFGRDSYLQGAAANPGLSLLDAHGSSDLFERAGFLQSIATAKQGKVDNYQLASVGSTNADSDARLALRQEAAARAKAEKAKKLAAGKVIAARTQLGALQKQKVGYEGELVQAKARLSGLLTARQAFVAWKAEQARLARIRAEHLRQLRLAAERKARLLAEARRRAEEHRRQVALQQERERKARVLEEARREAEARHKHALLVQQQEEQQKQTPQQAPADTDTGSSDEGNSDNSSDEGTSDQGTSDQGSSDEGTDDTSGDDTSGGDTSGDDTSGDTSGGDTSGDTTNDGSTDGSSDGSGDSSGGSGNESVSDSGGWTAEKGQQVVAAAEQWLGTPYAWAGGTADGPSEGQSPDEGITGFDCSGLALYAWAQVGVSLDHYSGYQYTSGSHPSIDAMMPGDLVFFSYDGTPASIHHVAIYIGNGQMIQAPQSGDVVKISPMRYSGLVGATRPGT